MATTKTATTTTPVGPSTNDILQEQQDEQRRCIAQSALYRSIIIKALEGQASDDDIQAGRILAQKWGWKYENDLAALKELASDKKNYGDYEQAITRARDALEAQATKCKQHHEDSQATTRELEIERSRLEYYHLGICQAWGRARQITKLYTHLFDASNVT